MAFEFKKTKDMDEAHLCNTISCLSERISESRRNECRAELIRRWLNADHIDLKSLREPDRNTHYNRTVENSISIDDILNKLYNIKTIK